MYFRLGFRYASLFFIACISKDENELITLEAIHLYVEVLDRYFGNVSQLVTFWNDFNTCFKGLRVGYHFQFSQSKWIHHSFSLECVANFWIYRRITSWMSFSWVVICKNRVNERFYGFAPSKKIMLMSLKKKVSHDLAKELDNVLFRSGAVC